MKKHCIYLLTITLTLLAGLWSCSTADEDLLPTDENSAAVPAGDVRITFRTNLPTTAVTRAGMLDSEADPAVTTLQMLCFDRYGTYVGRRTATALASDGTTPDKGTFEGSVPDVTTHIHFIGNLELTFPASSIGKHENVLMHSIETTTLYSSAPKMVYWGYVRKDTPEEMQAWLTPTSFLMTRVQPRAGAMGPSGCPVAWATLQPPPRPREPSWLILYPTWPWPMGAASLHRARSWWIRT